MGIAYMLMFVAGALFPDAFTGIGVAASLMILFVSAVITANFFPKMFGGIAGRFEHSVRGDHFEYQDKVTAFIEAGPATDTVQELLDATTALIFEQLNLSAIGIAVFGNDSRVRGNSTRELQRARTWSLALGADSPLFKFFRTIGRPSLDIRTDVRDGAEEREARAVLNAAGLEIAISIASRPKAPLGLIVTGPRRDGRPLTKLDVELLIALSRSLVFRIERIAIIQNEELRQSNKAKDHFLTSINHEIRNPMNGISGIVQMLGDHCGDQRSGFLLKTLQSCTDQLRSTMDDVLDFARIEADSVTLTVTEVNLVELVKTTCASQDISGERLVVTGAPAVPVVVQCDAGKVRQVLANYLANSLKYGVPVGADVALFVAPVCDDRIAATITVASTGPTLSDDETGVLFTALTRGRRARETNAHGTGLGLALCKKLAHAMGGTVGVNSAQGKTTFWFKAEFPTVSALPRPCSLDLARFSGRCALAIEDEPYNRLVLGHYLDRLQVSVIWAENGQAAIAAANSQTFDVILMDWLLPDMDGSELLAKIREQSQAPLPPVFVLSAYSTTSKRAECLAAGAVAFISKPIDLSKLTAAFDDCHFGPLAQPDDPSNKSTTIVDLSSLFALGNESFVITSFLRDVREGQARLGSIWRDDPRSAARLVHRLRAQMTLIHARDCMGVLEVLERGLNERWSADDIERLVTDVTVSLQDVAESVRDQGLRSAKPTAAIATSAPASVNSPF
ncbi:MAG: response regulator, partial [Opitutus sp.]